MMKREVWVTATGTQNGVPVRHRGVVEVEGETEREVEREYERKIRKVFPGLRVRRTSQRDSTYMTTVH